MSYQNQKMSYYLQMAKGRSGMVLTILAMVMCVTLILYSPLSYNPQFKFGQIKVPEVVQNHNVLDDDHKIEMVKVPEKAPSKTIEKAKECPLYVFGDSLYDTGMAFFNGIGPMADSYPYGNTYFNRPAGRFSDGLLIPDFIAKLANLPFPEPYGNPVFVDYAKAVNFAGAAAGVLVDGRNYSLNLKLQTDLFEEMVGRMKEQYGSKEAKRLVSDALLIFHIGSNDYCDIWIQTPNKPLNSSFVNFFVNKILGNFTDSITRMYNQGARKFAFQNYGPLGCLPLYLHDDGKEGKCNEELNDLAKIHNDRFAALAKTWARKLPGFKYTIYDFYTAMNFRFLDGAKYDFKETKTACCGSGRFRAEFTCMEKSNNFTLCDDISNYLFFDPAHPSHKADEQFAQEFWSGPRSLVAPYNLKTLCEIS